MRKKTRANFEDQLAKAMVGLILYVPLALFFFWLSKKASEDQFLQLKYVAIFMFVSLMIQGMRKAK